MKNENYLWAWIYDKLHPPPFSVYRSKEAAQWSQCIFNLTQCLADAGIEYARERHLLWTLFGWPLDGK